MPNSVLWICLVAIWLFVLVPMLIKNRPEIRKPTQATLATRVIDRGGRAMSRATRRISAGRHPHDAGWVAPEREYRKPGELINDDDDHADVRRERVAATVAADDAGESDEDAVVDLDAIHVGTPPRTRTAGEEADGAPEIVAEDADDIEDAEDTDGDASAGDADADHDDDADGELDDDLHDDDAADDDLDADADEPRRRGRGGYDAAADKRRGEKLYRRRQRVVLTLAMLALAGLGVGIALGGLGWVATGVTVAALVVYMAVLRRAVRIEEQIRRRRATRAARPQRRRDFDDVGDPFADEIPMHLRRPGAVVLEIDDEHPVFDHLPPFQHRRMMREEPDYRSAVGQ
ncbi:divisome protein SepX/GlpR [Williamsia deligens]|uniref:Gephyrin-like molybdotransferase receptor GlpR n=1 Tax=Williamsia deligens TaxID=321325 RepID=A0ABW3GDB7_9NOCA|nr:gephyrin-like molybdotransferase receptor GlpR [Williamsia deligens]MCP2192526.1 hypothetical protein [Williamsia deligens]